MSVKPLYWTAYLAASLFGLYRIKAATPGLNPDYLVGVFAYGVGFLLWLQIVRMSPLSIAFPLAAGALICGTQLLGVLLLAERYDAPKATGIVLILAGLVALALSDFQRGDG